MPPQSKTRFLLAGIQPRNVSDAQAFGPWRELWQLVESYGGQVVDTVIQRREVHEKGMYLGDGKIHEIASRLKAERIDVVALLDAVKPGHLYEIKTAWQKVSPEIEVWDRVDLILHIFSQHAHTAEARLQIELASMRHMGPRIYGLGMEMSRQGGGIGGRGIGETNTERMKRHWAAQMKRVETKLAKLAGDRERQLERRHKAGLKTISLIGYTNAGKTKLYNRLVGKQKFTRNMLFATLDASVGRLYLPDLQQDVLVSDTIGFIQGLPPELVEAFRSTLMESIFADVLIEVVDASDPRLPDQMAVVDEVLGHLQLNQRPRILVFNKIDAVGQEEIARLAAKFAALQPVFVSALNGDGIEELVDRTSGQLMAKALTV